MPSVCCAFSMGRGVCAAGGTSAGGGFVAVTSGEAMLPEATGGDSSGISSAAGDVFAARISRGSVPFSCCRAMVVAAVPVSGVGGRAPLPPGGSSVTAGDPSGPAGAAGIVGAGTAGGIGAIVPV